MSTQPNFTFGSPKPVLDLAQAGGAIGRRYDIAPDGKHFVVVAPNVPIESGDSSASRINVVLNWFTELQQRVPVK